MERLRLDDGEAIPKNFFLRDAEGLRHCLLVADKGGSVERPCALLGTSALSLPSRDGRLLGLEKGAVTPLGAVNDEGRAVEALFEAAQADEPVRRPPAKTRPPSFCPSRIGKPLSALPAIPSFWRVFDRLPNV